MLKLNGVAVSVDIFDRKSIGTWEIPGNPIPFLRNIAPNTHSPLPTSPY